MINCSVCGQKLADDTDRAAAILGSDMVQHANLYECVRYLKNENGRLEKMVDALTKANAQRMSKVERLRAELDSKCGYCCTPHSELLTDDFCMACERDNLQAELNAERERLDWMFMNCIIVFDPEKHWRLIETVEQIDELMKGGDAE